MILTIDAALDDPCKALGRMIVAQGREDSSCERRMIMRLLLQCEYTQSSVFLGIDWQACKALRARFVAWYEQEDNDAILE